MNAYFDLQYISIEKIANISWHRPPKYLHILAVVLLFQTFKAFWKSKISWSFIFSKKSIIMVKMYEIWLNFIVRELRRCIVITPTPLITQNKVSQDLTSKG